jgi:type I restriction enzyme S subunit
VSHTLKPYSEYQDSGLLWLGQVPKHWGVTRCKYLLRELNCRSESGKETLLSVSQYTGVTPRRSRSGSDEQDSRAETLVGYKIAATGDLVVNTMLAWNGSLGVASTDGIVSPAYAVYRFSGEAQPFYFHYLLRTPFYKGRFKAASTGVVESRLRLYPEDLLRVEACVPPAEEQHTIARYVGHLNRRTDALIRAKRRVIELLNEQKQAIIQRAVTRGLDPTARLKASGIDWLGYVPADWEFRRAKQLCKAIIDCKNRTPAMVEGGEFTVVRTTNVRHGRFVLDGSYPTDRRNYEIWTQRGAPKSGDVFFTREAPAGEACLVPDLDNLCMGQRMMYFRPDPALLDARFLLYSIYGPVGRTYVEHLSNGSTVGHLRLGDVFAFPILWCPVEEQRSIVQHIEASTFPLDCATDQANREITLLREYRTRLIADVVTVKLDVRGVELPEIDATETAAELEEGEVDGIEYAAGEDEAETCEVQP